MGVDVCYKPAKDIDAKFASMRKEAMEELAMTVSGLGIMITGCLLIDSKCRAMTHCFSALSESKGMAKTIRASGPSQRSHLS